MRTCGEVPLGGVLSGVHWLPLSLEPPPFSELTLNIFDYLEGLWRAGENLWGDATGWGPVWGPLASIVTRTSYLQRTRDNLEGCGELVRTYREVPLGGVLSGVHWPPLSPEPPPFKGLT